MGERSPTRTGAPSVVHSPPRPDPLVELVGAGRAGAVYWRPLPGEDRGARVVALVEAALAGGRGAIVVTPEVAAGSAVGDAVRKAFPDAADLASDLSDRRRYRAWAELRRGRRLVVVGGRSSVLAPLPALGCVVVDDEANFAHKEQRTPRFHARDVALRRAAVGRALCVLTGTVPSAEAMAAMQAGQCRLLTPDRAAERAARPLVEVVDPDDEGPTAARLHPRGLAAVRAALARDEPAYVLVPRRGGADPAAPGARTAGQVAAEVARILPGVPVWRLDREVLDPGMVPPWAGQRPGVVVGTVAGVKDHPPLTGCRTVVVVGADTALGQAEVRAAEEAYRTWSRAAAWCGPSRASAGRLVLQTRHGGHHAVQALVRWDPDLLWRHELPRRVELGFPARRLVLVEGPEPGEATAAMAALAAALGPKVELLGPAAMGRGWRIIAKVEDAESAARACAPARRGVPGRQPAPVGGRRAPRGPCRPPLASHPSKRRTGNVAMLEIRLYGDPVLKQRSDPVTRFDAELARFGDDLLETLRAAHGAGLAAPRSGCSSACSPTTSPPTRRPASTRSGSWSTRSSPAGRASRRATRAACRSPASTTPASGPWPSPWPPPTCAASGWSWTARGCWPAASSTRSTTWTGCCSSSGMSRGDRKRALKEWRERELDLELHGIAPHLHRSDLPGVRTSNPGPRSVPPDKTL